MTQLKAEHDSMTKTRQQEHEREIAELRASMGASSSAEIERLKAKHAEEIKELKATHEKLIAQLNGNFDRQLS